MRAGPLLAPPLVLALVWFGALWWPSQSAIADAEQRSQQARSAQLGLVTEIDQLNQITEQLSDLDADLLAITEAIPADPQIDAFLSSVAAAADAADVRVTLLSPNQVLDNSSADAARPVPPGMSAVAFVLEAQGRFDAVMAFIASLDDVPRLVVIDRIGMAAIDGEEQSIVIDMSLRIFAGGVAPLQAEVDVDLLSTEDIAPSEEGGRTRPGVPANSDDVPDEGQEIE